MGLRDLFRRDGIRIPKILKKLNTDEDAIRLRYRALHNPHIFPLKILPSYQIEFFDPKTVDDLMQFYVTRNILKGEWGKYGVTVYPSDGDEKVIRKNESLYSASTIAYTTARKIAMKIADANHIPFEDLTDEDEKALEDERLASEISLLGRKRSLDSRVGVFILSTLAGIALSVFSFRATGNAISNLTGTSQGLLGIFLFIVGLTGIAFNAKK